MVLDEFGGTAGVVTLEDLTKNLVQEIFGDSTTEPGAPQARVLELEGSAPATRLEEAFDLSFSGPGVQTVGGLLVQALGRIPRAGERFLLRGVEFDILAATSTRVERVLVRRGPVRTVALGNTEDRG